MHAHRVARLQSASACLFIACLQLATAATALNSQTLEDEAHDRAFHIDHSLFLPDLRLKQLQHAVFKKSQRKSLSCKGNASGTAWIEEYAEWHAANLGQPGAKYIIAFCGEGDLIKHKGKQERYCAGMGDRFRGLMEVLRLAYYSKRVFLIYWGTPATPEPLEAMLQPSTIDWRVKPEYKLDKQLPHSVYIYMAVPPVPIPEPLATGSFREKDKDSPVVAICWRIDDSHGDSGVPGPPLGALDSDSRACAWRLLFKPSALLESQSAAVRRQLMGDPVRPYIAIHLRLGGLAAEREDLNRVKNPLEALMTGLQCASLLALSFNLTTPILVLTDNALLRQEMARGRMQGVVGPKVAAAHIGKLDRLSHDDAVDAVHETFGELALLADARCLIVGQSGFNKVARIMGGQTCIIKVEHCMSIMNSKHKKTTRSLSSSPLRGAQAPLLLQLSSP